MKDILMIEDREVQKWKQGHHNFVPFLVGQSMMKRFQWESIPLVTNLHHIRMDPSK